MIRDSIARQTGVPAAPDPAAAFAAHVSHLRLPLVRGGDDDGACIIEPTVRCNSLRLLPVARTLDRQGHGQAGGTVWVRPILQITMPITDPAQMHICPAS